jgi:hypothetical protein
MRLIATRQTYSKEFGTAIAGQEIDVSDELGRELLKNGVMRKPDPPQIKYETKIIIPEAPEVSARQVFRNLLMSDQESETVAAESDPVLSEPDIPESGTADSSGRRGRKGLGSKR